jgi:homoserine kinase type II
LTDIGALVEAAIRDEWHLHLTALRAHDRGMNSRTWLALESERRWVAKAVPRAAHRRFVVGLEVAAIVDDFGIRTGRAELTADGRAWLDVGGHTLALLRFVDGQPLTGDEPGEQRVIGSTLARAHRALHGREVAGAERFHWLDLEASHLDVEPWVRPAIGAALAAYGELPPDSLTWGLLHSDPAPEAFLLDPESGACGLIDWDFGLIGPLMYDVASAAMYVGGPTRASALVDAYLAEGPISRTEVERALELMLRVRWAVQADYFARRLSANDVTGMSDRRENQDGLDDARAALIG